MKILRLYLKGFNGAYCEGPVPDGANMQSVITTFKMEHYLTSASPGMVPWAVPWDSWSFAAIIDVPDNGPTTVASPFRWDTPPKPN